MKNLTKKYQWLIILLITLTIGNDSYAQSNKGIQFENKLDWDGVLAKAKAEHKYIFVDCYATWCVPCRQMDANVYPQNRVGDIFNTFICVRLKMDRTGVDDAHTKRGYGIAKKITDDYSISAYPTFLFFDPDGKPVHRFTGGLDAKGLINLAADAKDPNKQYYAVLRNFQPGKLDTAEERGLAWSFLHTDGKLGGAIAADYFSRIPQSQLTTRANTTLMGHYANNAGIDSIGTVYIRNLKQNELVEADNLTLIALFRNIPEVKAMAENYINSLSPVSITNDNDQSLMECFIADPIVQLKVNDCFAALSDEILLRPDQGGYNILYLAGVFMNTPATESFKRIYGYEAKADSALHHPDWAASHITAAIANVTVEPALRIAKQSGAGPDFEAIRRQIANTYKSYYADRVITEGKFNWYGWLVNDKKELQFREDFLRMQVAREQYFPKPFGGSDINYVNNTCYDIFRYAKDAILIKQAACLIQALATQTPDDPDAADTYACVLYRNGDKNAAIDEEKTAMILADKAHDKNAVALYQMTIAEMEARKPIWEDKVRQEL